MKGSTIPESIIEEVKSRANLGEFAAEVVQLKRTGRSLVGLCPFHQEKTPSFHVHDDEGYFNCFGCGKKGSLFTFIMETKGLTFPEAVRFVAARVGVEIPRDAEQQAGDRGYQEQLGKLRALMRAAVEVYQRELAGSPRAAAYLKSRGITDETQRLYSLGFAPKGWEFILPAIRKQLEGQGSTLTGSSGGDLEPMLITLGLLKQRSGDDEEGQELRRGCYDSFRERLMFPIARSDGAPIAFGGRLLAADAKAPKYINSPESPLYAKRKTLYGLHQAMPTMRREKRAFLVEGYMDVLSMVQGGYTGSVACCGTALTPEHAKILSRFVERTTVVFDGDGAGRAAAAKSVEAFLNTGVDLYVAVLPQGEDPDSLVRAGELERLREAVERSSVAGLEFLLAQLIEEEGSTLTPAVSGRVAQRFATTVAKIANPVEKEFSLRRGAELLGVSMEALDRIVREETKRAQGRAAPTAEVARPTAPRVDRERAHSEVGRTDRNVSVPVEFSAPSTLPSPGVKRQAKVDAQEHAAKQFLYKQMVIALLCEPSLASPMLSLSEHETPLPKKLRRFFEAVAATEDLPNIHGVMKGGEEGAAAQRTLEALLQSHGLAGAGLLEEAIKQCTIGGSDPKRFLDDASRANNWTSVKQQVEVLHRQAAQSSDEVDKARLIQEKLLKRRSLERYRPER